MGGSSSPTVSVGEAPGAFALARCETGGRFAATATPGERGARVRTVPPTSPRALVDRETREPGAGRRLGAQPLNAGSRTAEVRETAAVDQGHRREAHREAEERGESGQEDRA